MSVKSVVIKEALEWFHFKPDNVTVDIGETFLIPEDTVFYARSIAVRGRLMVFGRIVLVG
jgi:hypothetical protein